MKLIKGRKLKCVADMTIKELLNCRQAGWDEEITCETLIVIPASGTKRKLHESGFRCMTFVATEKARPICKISGHSDVIHIEGIGGRGQRGISARDNIAAFNGSWNIDCLPKSGCLQLWTREKIKTGTALSSFEIFSGPSKQNSR